MCLTSSKIAVRFCICLSVHLHLSCNHTLPRDHKSGRGHLISTFIKCLRFETEIIIVCWRYNVLMLLLILHYLNCIQYPLSHGIHSSFSESTPTLHSIISAHFANHYSIDTHLLTCCIRTPVYLLVMLGSSIQ